MQFHVDFKRTLNKNKYINSYRSCDTQYINIIVDVLNFVSYFNEFIKSYLTMK